MKPAFQLLMTGKALSRWLYPSWCVLCQKYLHLTEDFLCRPCFIKLNRLKAPLCKRCGVEIPPFKNSGNRLCQKCRKIQLGFDEVISIFRYDEHFKNLLHQVKYERKYWLLDTFTKQIERTLETQWQTRPSFIVPVPLDRKRQRERTFNQSLILAQKLSKILNVPLLDNTLIRRETRVPQSHLGRKERMANLNQLFKIRKSHSIKNSWILIVDDVVTTGATAHECSITFKEQGASKVSVFALARTPSLS